MGYQMNKNNVGLHIASWVENSRLSMLNLEEYMPAMYDDEITDAISEQYLILARLRKVFSNEAHFVGSTARSDITTKITNK